MGKTQSVRKKELKSPYMRTIRSNGDGITSTSPAYCLTFVRWENRDTVNYRGNNLSVRSPLVVINDAISIEMSESKSQVTPSVSISLKGGDIDYAAAIAPGDYLFVNLVNSPEEAVRIREKALNSPHPKPINEFNDGFKGLFKVQASRRQITVDSASGKKILTYTIHGFGFTELKTLVYYNPIVSQALATNPIYFISQFKDMFSEIATSYQNEANLQKVLRLLIKMLLSQGLNKSDQSIPPTQNAHFLIPSGVGHLLGRPRAKTITDIYNWVLGIWKFQPISNKSNLPPGKGFNPSIAKRKNDVSIYEVTGGESSRLQGYKIMAFEDFNQKTIWSIFSNFLNSAINEMYTTTRVGPDGRVYPTVIFRQKPFNSRHFTLAGEVNGNKVKKETIPHTKFFDLPRWRITPDLLYQVNLGKDEAARVNFIQLFGRAIAVNDIINQGLQARNIFYDPKDIVRHGLKPIVATANFDFPNLEKGNGIASLKSKKWAFLLFDMLNAGQLRESGVMTTYGITEPICVGDNLLFDSTVYHIEQVMHRLQIDTNSGAVNFRTNLKLSFGTKIGSNTSRPIYPQMENVNAEAERIDDYQSENILPGNTDVQDLPNSHRVEGEEFSGNPKTSGNATFTKKGVSEVGQNRVDTISYTIEDDEKGK